MKNNFPTNIARAMGADVIIGVDVQNDLRTADELNNLSEIFNQIINLTGQTRYEENIKLATVYIKVDVKGYSAASFNIPALDTLVNRGEEAAREQWTALQKLKKEIDCLRTMLPRVMVRSVHCGLRKTFLLRRSLLTASRIVTRNGSCIAVT